MSSAGIGIPSLSPTREEFRDLAGQGNLVPVFAELSADLDTSLSAYLRLRPGAVGYASSSGNLDSCPTIRTIVCHGRRASIQVGGGMVADSDPKTEWLETCCGLSNPFVATRYHSLVVLPDTVPAELEVMARAEDGEVMGLRHRRHPVEGAQFHPESIITIEGKRLLANFLGRARPRGGRAGRRREGP